MLFCNNYIILVVARFRLNLKKLEPDFTTVIAIINGKN